MMAEGGRHVKSEKFPDVISLLTGHPHPDLLMPKESFLDSVKAAMSTRSSKELFNYGGETGDDKCLSALARFLTEEGKLAKPIEPGRLFIGAGVSYCLELACSVFTKPGDIILTEDPTYFLACKIFESNGLKPIGVPIDEHGLDVDRVEEILNGLEPGQKVSAVYTIPIHQNPTGVCLSPERKVRLIELAHRHKFRIFADEVYWLLGFEGEREPVHQSMCDVPGADGVLCGISSFSKIIGPGFRFGWIRASTDDIEMLGKAGHILSGGGVTHLSCVLLTHALESGFISKWLVTVRRELSKQCKALCDELRNQSHLLEFTEPKGGYFIWISPKMNLDVSEVLKTSKSQYGFTCLAGASCSPDAKNSAFKDKLRYCFAYHQPDVLIEGARRAATCLADHKIRCESKI